jgi:hypothetical protein
MRANTVPENSVVGRREETPMRNHADRRSTPRLLARPSTASVEPGPKGRTLGHRMAAWWMRGRSRLAPLAWSSPSTAIRARGAGSVDMSWSGRELAEGLLGRMER